MELDRNGLEVLSEEECFGLLAHVHLGRLGLTVGALPVILPVHFALQGRDVVFRTGQGTKLDAAMSHQVLCLEADGADSFTHQGWSVLVTGRGEEIIDAGALAEARSLPLLPWTPNRGNRFVRLRPELVSGRRITLEAFVRGGAQPISSVFRSGPP